MPVSKRWVDGPLAKAQNVFLIPGVDLPYHNIKYIGNIGLYLAWGLHKMHPRPLISPKRISVPVVLSSLTDRYYR